LSGAVVAGQANNGGNYVRIQDPVNGYEVTVDNTLRVERWTQNAYVTPTNGSTSADTTIVLPAAFTAERYAICVITALGGVGLTTFGVGWLGAPNALIAAAAKTLSYNPSGTLAVSSGGVARTIRLTADAGTFDGTGNVRVAVTAYRFEFGE
jgi:hypothetical protein